MQTEKLRDRCPVCDHGIYQPGYWAIPFKTLDQGVVIGGGTTNEFPCLDGELIHFHRCLQCDSVFRDPCPVGGHTGDHYVRKMKDDKAWLGYKYRYHFFMPHVSPDAKIMVDAACGVGQYLTVAKRENERRWERFIGIEYGKTYVDYIAGLGCEALQCDLDLQAVPLPDAVADLVVFSEAFEHMYSAYVVMQKLAALVKPGGVLFFSAQALGSPLPVRPEETIYVNVRGLRAVCNAASLKIADLQERAGRWLVVAVKL